MRAKLRVFCGREYWALSLLERCGELVSSDQGELQLFLLKRDAVEEAREFDPEARVIKVQVSSVD